MPSAERLHEYRFERRKRSVRTTEGAKDASVTFLRRVKCEKEEEGTEDFLAPLPREDRRLVLEFMIASVLNIDWYDKKLLWESGGRFLFALLSLALLVGVPYGLFRLSQGGVVTGSENLDIAGTVTALLSTVIALQKSFSAWFKKRKRAGAFWKARSSIKETLYTLEGEYDGRAFQKTDGGVEEAVLTDKFKKAVLEATARCRKIASDERQEFFEQESMPTFDLTSLTSAKTEATKLVKAFRSDLAVAREEATEKERAAAKGRAEAEDGLARAELAYDSLGKLASKISKKLQGAGENEKADIGKQLGSVREEQEKVSKEMLASQIRLAKMGGL